MCRIPDFLYAQVSEECCILNRGLRECRMEIGWLRVYVYAFARAVATDASVHGTQYSAYVTTSAARHQPVGGSTAAHSPPPLAHGMGTLHALATAWALGGRAT